MRSTKERLKNYGQYECSTVMELFRARILKGGTSCIDELGNKYAINGLVIIKADGRHVFYDKTDSFYKAVCAEKTWHEAKELENGKVNIY